MLSDERQFWYALTLLGSGLVLIGTSNQNGLGEFLTVTGGLWILWLESERILDAFRYPWHRLRRQSTEAPDKIPPMRDAISMVRTPPPESLNELPFITFSTGGLKARHIETAGRRPNKLRFLTPNELVVEAKDLPAIVPLVGKGRLIIKRFSRTGFLIEEDNTVGDYVTAELYFDESGVDERNEGQSTIVQQAPLQEAATVTSTTWSESSAVSPTKENLNVVYAVNDSPESQLVWLKFLPDTLNREQFPNRNGDAFLLILLGYRFLRGWGQVPTDHARAALTLSRCHFARPDLREWEVPGPELEPDPVAAPYMRHGYIQKTGLASGGGGFRLTPEGIQAATRLFRDMINRA